MSYNDDAIHNLIFYGPPGTGKTFALQQLLKDVYTETVEELSYEDWQALQIYEHIRSLKWWEVLAAALYELGAETSTEREPAYVRVPQLAEHPYVVAVAEAKGHSGAMLSNVRQSLTFHTIQASKTVLNQHARYEPQLFDKTESACWYLVEGWETQAAYLKERVDMIKQGPVKKSMTFQRYEFVTFHQSYGYEEFVEGLRPVVGKAGQIRYEIQSGLFLRLCERARRDPLHRYAMMIDEINRGNISKIFGELMTLIEADKREGAAQAVSVTLPYSGKVFTVPANVDVIGTMNTADRSLALMDMALRRRFEFIEKMPQPDILNGLVIHLEEGDIDIRQLLTTINKRIEVLYDREHTLGHAYFTVLMQLDATQQFEALTGIFKHKILPLLQEYFFEDWQKIRWVLGDNQKTDPQLQFIQEFRQEEDLIELFGRDRDLNSYTAHARYQVNVESFSKVGAYIGIYAGS